VLWLVLLATDLLELQDSVLDTGQAAGVGLVRRGFGDRLDEEGLGGGFGGWRTRFVCVYDEDVGGVWLLRLWFGCCCCCDGRAVAGDCDGVGEAGWGRVGGGGCCGGGGGGGGGG